VPDDLALFEEIAAAMAEGREPDVSSFDPSQVRRALERVLRFPGPRGNFLSWLNGRVQVLSGGRVSIEERPIPDQPLENGGVETITPELIAVPELPVRVVVQGEFFAEPAVVRADNPVVQFPMRG
jgi:hypothetical protein